MKHLVVHFVVRCIKRKLNVPRNKREKFKEMRPGKKESRKRRRRKKKKVTMI